MMPFDPGRFDVMLGFRRVFQHVVAAVAVVDDVVAQAKLIGDDGGQRLDAVGIDLAQLLDPLQDIIEFRHQFLDLGIAHGDARKPGDMADLFGVYRHGSR